MRNVLLLALKDLKLLWRDRFGLFWIGIWPVLFALFFGALFAGAGGGGTSVMKIAVVDEDDSEDSRAFVKRLEASEALEVERMGRQEAVDAVRRGRRTAYVLVKKGYGEANGFFGGEAPPVEVGIDPSRKAEGGYLQGLLIEASFAAMQERLTDPKKMKATTKDALKGVEESDDLDEKQKESFRKFLGGLEGLYDSFDEEEMKESPGMQPVRIDVVEVTRERAAPRSSWEITFPSAILWALIGCAAGFAIGIVIERRQGTLLRLRISPLSRAHILAGKGLACFLACLTVSVFLLMFAMLVFGVRVGNWPVLILALVCTGICFVGLMMLMSVLGRTEQAVAGAGWAILLVLAMVGGGMVPLFIMPSWMQTASHFSPVKWGILSIEGAVWRGFTLSEMLLPCGILVGIGVVAFAVGVKLFSRFDA